MEKVVPRHSFLLAAALLLSGFLTAFQAGRTQDPAPASPNRYIGTSKCKSCHQAEEKGNQYVAWENAPHSKAFETLGGDAAKALGAKLGIPDPQKAPECLRCHTTAFGVEPKLVKKGFQVEQGVQCEVCHGPGEAHMKARFQAAAADRPEEKPAPGEILLGVEQETCLRCHNEESPSFKPFCFVERLAQIRHPRPDSTRPVLVCGCEPCDCTKGCPDDGCGVPAK